MCGLIIGNLNNNKRFKMAIRHSSEIKRSRAQWLRIMCLCCFVFFLLRLNFFTSRRRINRYLHTYLDIVYLPLLRSVLKNLLINAVFRGSRFVAARARDGVSSSERTCHERVSLLFFSIVFSFFFFSYVRSARKRHFRDCALLVARGATRETNGTHTCSRAR